MKNMHVKLEVLTPVHVSSGESLDPLSYIIKRENAKIYSYLVDTTAWLADQADPNEWAELFAKLDYHSIRQRVSTAIPAEAYCLCKSRILNETICKNYEKTLNNPQSKSLSEISPLMHSAFTYTPVLPGSSIKGAIRTCVIDYLDQKEHLNLKQNHQLNKKYNALLGPPWGKNTFQTIKIGDFSAGLDSSLLVSAQEVGKSSNKLPTPKSDCEVFASKVNPSSDKNPYCLYGKISLGRGENEDFEIPGKEIFSWDELAELVSKFFIKRYQKEYKDFYDHGPHDYVGENLKKTVNQEITSPKPGQMVLRVGHYSHVECVTITNNAPKGKKGKFGNTRTLADGEFPFGWIKITPCQEQEYQAALEEQRKQSQTIFNKRKAKRESYKSGLFEKAQKEAEFRQKLEKEKQEKEKREKALAQLSPEEREIQEFFDRTLNDNQIFELFKKIDKFEEKQRLLLPKEFKKYFQETNNWKVSKKKKKQLEKVQKIKEILGAA